MSKYNHMHSIPVDSIKKEEIADAIKEWAEGNESMEKLLWACYSRGIKTNGCHAGGHPYISIDYNNKIDSISKLINVIQDMKDSRVFIIIAGNPYSGIDWCIPSITFSYNTMYRDEAEVFFDKLRSELECSNQNKKANDILFKLTEFFANRRLCLGFDIKHTLDDKYEFSIDSGYVDNDRYVYYNDIFTSVGLKEYFVDNIRNMYFWKIQSDTLGDLLNKIDFVTNFIINNFLFTLPTNVEEIPNLKEKALFMKEKLSEKEFEEWLKQQRKNYYM